MIVFQKKFVDFFQNKCEWGHAQIFSATKKWKDGDEHVNWNRGSLAAALATVTAVTAVTVATSRIYSDKTQNAQNENKNFIQQNQDELDTNLYWKIIESNNYLVIVVA